MRLLGGIAAALLLGCHLLLPLGQPDRAAPDHGAPDRDRAIPSCPAMAVDAGPPVFTSCCSRCGSYTGTGRVVWPSAVGAMSVAQCSTSGGPACNSSGVCAASFLRYGGCPEWKAYDLPDGCKDVVIWACSDGCEVSNVLTDVTFVVEELQGTTWVQTRSVSHPELETQCACAAEEHTATSSTLRIRSTGASGFYVCLFVR
jgi:hypothetical protein